jgi:hypothetical protein
MAHRQLSGGATIRCALALVMLSAGSADVSNAAPVVELSKPSGDAHLEQAKKMERTAQISTRVQF